jgi:hypothetical protein
MFLAIVSTSSMSGFYAIDIKGRGEAFCIRLTIVWAELHLDAEFFS